MCQSDFQIATVELPPLNVFADNAFSGVFASSIKRRLIAQKTTGSFQKFSWARALASAEIGLVDAIYPTIKSESRAEYLDFSMAPISEVTIALYQRDSGQESTTLHDNAIQGSVAILRSIEFDRDHPDFILAKYYEVVDFKQAYLMLENGRVDYLIAIKEVIEHFNQVNQINNISQVKILEKQPVYLALAKNGKNYNAIKGCLADKH